MAHSETTTSTIPRRLATSPHADQSHSADWLLLATVVLCSLGLVMAVSIQGSRYGATPLLAMKSQGSHLAVGFFALILCAVVPLGLLRRHARTLFLVSTGLTFLAAFYGNPVKSSCRWINFAGMQFQPVDLARLATVIYCAKLIADAGPRLKEFRRGFLGTMWPPALLAVALLMQPDNGNAIFILALVACMVVVAGTRISYFLLLGLPALTGVVLIALRMPYVRARVFTCLHPVPGSQVWQSLVAIASGGLFGRGLGNGWMKMGYVPEAGNDFVFAIIGEELGLMGSVLVLGLYCTVGFMGLRLFMNCRDGFLRMLIFGLTLALCMQAAINLLVVTGLAPAKGIDLPFLSSGGTNLVVCLAAIGLLGNAARADARMPDL